MVQGAFQRARRPDQIEQRRSQILRAAALALEEEGLDGATLNGIARRAGLSKSNIYRYFENREAIFLELISSDWVDFAAEIEARLIRLEGGHDVDAVARVIGSAFSSRSRFCELNSVLSVFVERNVSESTIVDFRGRVGELGLGLAKALHGALPRIPVIRCIWAIGVVHAAVAGLWGMTNRPQGEGGLLEGLEFSRLHGPFPEDLESTVRVLLYGLLVEAARTN